jgi:enamine deaminase RidA (YjgF/YER057c/UK114 family)
MIDGELPAHGKVGAEIDPDAARLLARTCVLNGLAAARTAIGSLDRITRVIKVVGFVASDPGFFGQPQVINGASELLVEIFGEAGTHARSAVGVAVLPLNAPVEVEFVFEFA